MANQHTAALEARAAELAVEWKAATVRSIELEQLILHPQCGKPGKGYKAARKARKEYNAVSDQMLAINKSVDEFIKGSSKDSQEKRGRRYTYWSIALQNS
jgi:hypothetical protein